MTKPINENVTELIDERVKVYGDPKVTFPQIAQVWSAVLGVEVRPDQVPLCLIAMKLVRTSQTPDYSDNSDDIEGYLDIFRKVVGEDMVHARTVDEYVKKKRGRSAAAEPAHRIVTAPGKYVCDSCDWQILEGDARTSFGARVAFEMHHDTECAETGETVTMPCYYDQGCGCRVYV